MREIATRHCGKQLAKEVRKKMGTPDKARHRGTKVEGPNKARPQGTKVVVPDKARHHGAKVGALHKATSRRYE